MIWTHPVLPYELVVAYCVTAGTAIWLVTSIVLRRLR